MRAAEIRIVRGVGFEDGVDGGQQHPANSNNCFLVPTTLFEQKIAVLDFRVLCGVANGESALHKQRFEESARTGDTSGFLLAGALIVLGNESRPRTEMFRRREHGHIHADFGDNGNGRSGLDTRNGRNEINLRSEVFGKRRNKSIDFSTSLVNGVKVGTDNAEFRHLFGTNKSVHSGLDLADWRFAFRIDNRRNVEISVRANGKHVHDCGTGFAEYVGENVIEFNVGDGKAILCAVLLTDRDVCKFVAVTGEVA